ncbi:MAG: ABC transporter permease [Cellulomonadaceae bacterium]|nr:ABC transporter permease [Cellulomonadaceae bacterium]
MPPDTTAPVPGTVTAGRASGQVDRELEAGLDALQTAVGQPAARARRALGAAWPPALALVVILTVWEGYVRLGFKPRYVVPGPTDVAEALTDLWQAGQAQTALLTSLERGLIGFVVAVAIATPLGLLVARVRWLRVSVGPLISGLQVLPSVAWVPAAIIWFRLSDATVYFVILMGAVPSIINGLVSGVDQVPPLFRQVGRVLGANPWEQVRYVVLPAALPGYLTGLRQGWAFSWRSLMAAEIIAVGGNIGFGLGALLQQGRELSDMRTVIAAILLILVVGVAVELAFFAPLERSLLRRRGLSAETSR